MGSFRRQQLIDYNEEPHDEVLKILSAFPELQNGETGMYDITALQVAAAFTVKGITSTLKRLVTLGSNVNQSDQLGRTPLHYAALNGNTELLELLLNSGADTECKFRYHEMKLRISQENYSKWNKLYARLPPPDGWGRTPLHLAAKQGHVSALKCLIDKANVNSEDDKGVTPLLLAGHSKNKFEFEEIVKLLVGKGADVHKRNDVTGTTALFHAVALKSAKATKCLLASGAWMKEGPCQQTELHEAASNGLMEILQCFLDDPRITLDDVNRPDGCRRTPLYRAACSGHKDCSRLLIQRGADLGHVTKAQETIMDAIFCHVTRPAGFIKEILDSRITGNGCKITAEDYRITLDFSLLAPYGKDRQMNVITNLLAAANEREKILMLQHPLIESYLRLKWSKIRNFFCLLIYIYVTFVLSLSAYVILMIHKSPSLNIVAGIAKYSLIATSGGLLGHAIIQCVLSWRSLLKQYEMWMNLSCTSLSLTVALIGGNSLEDVNINNTPSWVLHATSVAVLLAWTELMLLIGRFPSYGYYALMFAAVLQNVVKVLLTFVCLVIGFALSFAVQFHNYEQFTDPWRALVKTTVMMMGEFEYADLFADNTNGPSRLPATSRVIFLLFIILASIVLMNLMVGLAVSDIQGLQQEGNVRRLEKQAEFLHHLEKVISFKAVHATWFPAWFRDMLKRKRSIDTKLCIQPELSGGARFETRRIRKLPCKLVETIVDVASKQHVQEDDVFSNKKFPELIETLKMIIKTYEARTAAEN